MKDSFYTRRGFSLVETILAITVIGLVITAAAQLTQRSLALGRITMNQFIAYHLAEEGLEVVRSLRDSNWLQNVAWRVGLADGTYVVKETRGNFAGSGAAWRLEKLQPGDEKAAQITLSEREIFSRTIEITSGDDPKKVMRVKSTVTYEDRDQKRQVLLTTELTDWKKGPL